MTGYRTDPIPAYIRRSRPQTAQTDIRAETEAQKRRRRIQATKGENFRALMRAPQSNRA